MIRRANVKKPRSSINARCSAHKKSVNEAGQDILLWCGRSKGHEKSSDHKRRRHYDASHDREW